MRPSLALLACFALTAQAADAPMPLRGYSSASAATERDWEKKFRDIPSTGILRENMRRLTAHPHHVGSPYDKDNAEWILAQLKSWGLDARIEVFDTLFPTPKTRLVEMVGPTSFKAKLQEPTIAVDPTSGQHDEQLPTYNAYSVDGDVTAPLVYVNFGTIGDYEELDRLGISVKGAIVIARYGGSWRGVKPKLAAEHGAIGCLIYSDPHEDGYAVGDTYPDGPNRPRTSVQRGSVLDMALHPGDPQTPGVGATVDAKKVPLAEVDTLTKIPVLPLSQEDAEPLMKALAGPVAVAGWRGSMPLTYHVGPGPAQVHLRATFNWDRKPLYDVIARIPGAQFPDEWVIRGNHHDAWVNGAADPVSGLSPELEEARSLAALLKQGWRPKRTILYCFWDGEEPGLLGSTEWAETHAEELKRNAIAYVNTDLSGRGIFQADGSHSLEAFINNVVKDIDDPETSMSVWKRARLASQANAAPERRAELKSRSDLRIDAMGSGSDYSVFIDHLGIPSLNMGFGGEDHDGGQYHSIYDDFYWYTHFADPDFVYGRVLAQTVGTAMLRLADADIIPYQFTNFADTVHGYVDEVKRLSMDQRNRALQRNADLEDGVFQAIADPKQKTAVPVRETVPPFLNFAPLDNASDALTRAAEAFERALASAGDGAATKVNARLIQSERLLCDAAGLPKRPWYQNLIYAPGAYTGYGAKTLPGVRESVEQKEWAEADRQIVRVAKALQDEAHLLDEAAADLRPVK